MKRGEEKDDVEAYKQELLLWIINENGWKKLPYKW